MKKLKITSYKKLLKKGIYMSIWTNVRAVIEFEVYEDLEKATKEIDDIIGRELLFDEMMNLEDEEYEDILNNQNLLPRGSEGTLRKSSTLNIINEDFNGLYTVTVTGSIRDYNNEEELQLWLSKIVKHDALIDITGQYSSSYFLNDKAEFHKVFYPRWDEKEGCYLKFIDISE